MNPDQHGVDWLPSYGDRSLKEREGEIERERERERESVCVCVRERERERERERPCAQGLSLVSENTKPPTLLLPLSRSARVVTGV